MGVDKRSLMLPGPVRAEEIQADYEDGVLTITIPKAEKEDVQSGNISLD